METLTLKEIANALGTQTKFDTQVNAVCIDTRKITKGCLFICIKVNDLMPTNLQMKP